MHDDAELEGRGGVARVEAFSDGVLAIVVTIMVLELKAPERAGLSALWELWPTFFAYVLSYSYVAIYWVNHHRLFSHARIVTNSLVWSNIGLLFALSMLPFTTSYFGKHFLDPISTSLYSLSLLAPAGFFTWLRRVISRTGLQSHEAMLYYKMTTRMGAMATAAYAISVPLSWWMPAAGVTLSGIVGLFWMMPWGKVDRADEGNVR